MRGLRKWAVAIWRGELEMKPTGFSRWKEPKRWCKGAVFWSLVAEKKWRRRTVASRGWGIWRGRRLSGSCREWKCGCITQTEQGEGLKVNGLLAFGCDERKGWCRGFGFRMKMEETQMSNPPEKSQTVGRDLQRKVGALSFWRKGSVFGGREKVTWLFSEVITKIFLLLN